MIMPEVSELLQTQDLQEYIRLHALAATVIRPARPTPTVAMAAEAVGVEPAQIIKSLLFVADGQPVLVIASGEDRVDRKLLARHLGLSRKRVKMASVQEVERITGYGVGGVPPFGHRSLLRTLLDSRILNLTWVYGGGGADDVLLRVRPEEIVRAVGAEALSLMDVEQ